MRQEPPGQPRPPAPSAPAGQPDMNGIGRSVPVQPPRWVYLLVTVAAVLIGVTAIVRQTRTVASITDSDLTNFFFKSANDILAGHPFQMYAVRGSGLTATYPNYNPPLSMFLMAPLLSLAHAFGFAASYGAQITFVSLPFIVFVPLLGFLVLRALNHLHPQIPETQRLLAFMLVVLSPLTWQSLATWYHLEQPMMLCFLVAAIFALQIRREGLAGVLAGLALLTRTTSLMPLIAIGVLLLLARQWRTLFTFGGVAAIVTAIGMAPFFLFDRRDFTYAFVSWRGGAEIGGNSIWTIFAYNGHSSSLRHLLDAVARRLDSPAVVLFLLVATFMAVRRYRVSVYSRDAWAVAAIAALAVPMLSKTVWPYYYLEPFILLVVWEFTTLHDRRAGVWRWPVLSLSYLLVAATLSQYIGLQSVGALDRISVGIVNFGAMLGFAIAIWQRMGAAKPVIAPAGVSSGDRAPVSGGFAGAMALQASVGPMPLPMHGAPATPLPPSPSSRSPQQAPQHPFGVRDLHTENAGASAVPDVPEEWPDLDAAWPPHPSPAPRDR